MASGSALFWASGYFRTQSRPDEWPGIVLGTDLAEFWMGWLLAAIASLGHLFFISYFSFEPRFECTRMAGESKVWQSMTTSSRGPLHQRV